MTRSERSGARIAVDLLGGDDAPAVVVDGALLALEVDPDIRLLPVGPPALLGELVARVPAAHRDRLEPVSVRAAPIRRAAELLAEHRVDAMVSAGATGGAITAAVAGCGRYPGLARPALAVTIPTPSGRLILLDVGASPNPSPADLVRHAMLGVGYATATTAVHAPRVGLLSIGTEDGSGDRLRREADPLLRVAPLPAGARYVGLVEGYDVPLGGSADVVVTDGFTGNVLLKGIEAALRLPGPSGAGATVEPGAPRAAALLGVTGPVVICHGAAGPTDLASGIALAGQLVADGTIERVTALAGAAEPASGRPAPTGPGRRPATDDPTPASEPGA